MGKADQIDEDHPLVLEISSLKAAVSRFQDEAHGASLKLQRFSFDTSNAQDRMATLERENEFLRTELYILRANPHPDQSPTSHPAVLQSQELTLSLRRLSTKLSETEHTLLERTTELAHATSEMAKSRISTDAAYALAARTRGREEEGLVRERELEMKIRELKEANKLEDLVVKEYADLVRTLEGRNGTVVHTESASLNGSTTTLVDGITEGKAGLQKLFAEFSAESEQLRAEADRLQGELVASNMQLETERITSEADRRALASIQHELALLKTEDKSAAAMVSRYMKFSQTSTNTLQNSFNTLKTRHSATIDTFAHQLASLSAQLQSSQITSNKLRTTLDECGKDIMRESYGRRREIALRLKLVVREEALQEALGRWIRKGQETLNQEHDQIPRQSLERLLSDARAVYAVLDTPSTAKAPMPPVSESLYSPYSAPTGSLARMIATEASVKSLVDELHIQTSRRQELELLVASSDPVPPVPVKDKARVHVKAERNLAEPTVNGVSLDQDEAVTPVTEALSPSEQVNGHQSHPPKVDPVAPPLGLSVELNRSTEEPDAIPASEDPPVTQVESPSVAEQPSQESEVFPAAPDFPSLEEDTGTAEETGPLASENDLHPLIDELTHVNHRYDDLQRAFRDCHLAIHELRKTISSTDEPDALSLTTINGVSSQIFQAAIERLDNYNEDARVELEIRAADEALLAQGYQTMLSLGLPMRSSMPPSPSLASSLTRSLSHDSQQESEAISNDLEAQIRDFTSGADMNVQRAMKNLSRKLEDVQNDIAVIKQAMYDPDAFGPSSPVTTPTGNGLNSASSVSSSGWTAWIRGTPSRPDSPSPAPTFGHVMTTPRLKHSSSFHHDMGMKRHGSVTDPNGNQAHPFANLDLRVSMPAFSTSRSAVFSPPGIDWHGPRTRTVSTMHMLGLGTARSASSTGESPRPQRSASSEVVEEYKEDSDDEVE